MQRPVLFLATLALASLGLATPVLAAAPSNDLYTDRTVIPATPFTDVVDTTEATTDADDAELLAQCNAPAADASVWYEYTAVGYAELSITTFESDYPVGVIVAIGSPGAFSLVTCGPGSVPLSTVPDETYAILLFDFQGDGGGNGGQLAMQLAELPPPPELDVTVSTTGSFDPVSGSATIRGTVTCTGGDSDSKTSIDVQVSQTVGRFRFNGQGFATFACDGNTNAWEAEAFSDAGKFSGGKASVRLFAFVCTQTGCDEVELTAIVTLRK